MHAAQRIPSQIMIELGIGPHRLPACRGVTIRARDRNRTVRTGDLGFRCLDTVADTRAATGASGGIRNRVASRICARAHTGLRGGIRGGQHNAPARRERRIAEHGCQNQESSDDAESNIHRSPRVIRLCKSPRAQSSPPVLKVHTQSPMR